jgi:antitoxin Phd
VVATETFSSKHEYIGCIYPKIGVQCSQGGDIMNINIDNLVSISEANQNFSKVARLVDEKGTALILKNNAPRYILLDYNLFRQNAVADDTDVDMAAKNLLSKHIKAFEELAR